MELKSEPQYELVTVTDIDIAFPGDLQTFTLWAGDTRTQDADTLTLMFAHGGVMTFNLKHVHFVATKSRQMRVIKTETAKDPQ